MVGGERDSQERTQRVNAETTERVDVPTQPRGLMYRRCAECAPV